MKRPSIDDAVDAPGLAVKRIKRCHHSLKKKQANAHLSIDHPQDDFLPQGQLLRAIALTLNAAGFDGATPGALEALRADTEQYILRLMGGVQSSMTANRRTKPSPQDFMMGLASQNVTSSSLLPHIKLHAPPSVTQPPLSLPSPPEPPPPTLESILGQGLSGRTEKSKRPYIPRHFPDLPSRHTWCHTQANTGRVTDPRQIRERATEEGVLAEQALRKLMLARSTGLQNRARGMDRQSKAARRRDEIWEATMKMVMETDEAERKLQEHDDMDVDFGSDDGYGVDSFEKARRDMDDAVMVNYEKRYWRKAAQSRH